MRPILVKIFFTAVWLVAFGDLALGMGASELRSFMFTDEGRSPAQVYQELSRKTYDNKIRERKNFGYSDQEGWFLFELHGDAGKNLLIIKNPLFTSLRAFNRQDELPRKTAGGIDYFEVDPKQMILIAVKSNTIHDLSLELLSAQELRQRAGIHSILIGFYALVILAMMAAAILSAIGESDRSVFLYSSVIAFFHGFAILSLFGFPINWLFFDLIAFKAWTIIASEGAACMASLAFISVAIKHDPRSRRMRKGLFAIAGLTLFASFFVQGVAITIFTFLLCVMTIIAGGIIILQNKSKLGELRPYVIGFIAIGSGTLLFSLQYIGLLDTFELRYVILLGAFIDVSLTLGVFVRIMSSKRKTRDSLHFALGGIASYADIEGAFEEAEGISLQSQFATTTTMFIDFSRFSSVVKREDAVHLKDVEDCIQVIMTAIREIVFEHNGIVNKSLGDGLLVYFGHSLSGRVIPHHEQHAVECALAIHRSVLHLIASGKCKYPFATRIGINSGRVRIGNMAADRIDYSVLGHAVNLAQRYEAGAALFETVISLDIKQKIKMDDLPLSDRLISIKNEAELQAVASFSALSPECEDEFMLAYQKYLEYHQFERREDRFQLNSRMALTLSSPLEEDWVILDFSKTGLRVLSSKNLCVRVTARGRVGRFLVNAVVMWSRKAEDGKGYHLGLHITSFDESEMQAFHEFLSTHGNLSLVRQTNHF